MRDFSAKTRYALLAALDLADHYRTGKPVKIQDIALRTGAPAKYLVHVLLQLKRRVLVNSTRGPRGGYWLARPPELISAGEVIAAVEGTTSRRAVSHGRSARERALNVLWQGAQNEERKFLASLTLADLLEQAPGE